MKPSWFRIRFGLSLLIAIFATGCAHIREPLHSGPPLYSVTGATGQAVEVGVTDPAMVIHIDPKTGEIMSPPVAALPGQAPKPSVDAAKKLPAELRETLSPVPGGGVVIHLDERFMNPLTATVDAEGKVRHEHKQTMSGSDEK